MPVLKKEIGVIGLGKMGKNISIRLLKKGYRIVAYNRSEEPRMGIAKQGAEVVASLRNLTERLRGRRVVWLMLPAGEATENAVNQLSKLLGRGDVIIDGSNSRYTDSVRHYNTLKSRDIRFLDAGCSGGPQGALNGMCIMIGGDKDAFQGVRRLFSDLSVKDGYAHIGESGAGHFVKMVHNAIEYGMMQSVAEGAELLVSGPYRDLKISKIYDLWNNGSVIRGNLVELAARALEKDPKLGYAKPFVEDTGEARWAAHTAIDLGIPLTSITHSLFERFSSRNGYQFGRRLLAALRHEFGGHEVRK